MWIIKSQVQKDHAEFLNPNRCIWPMGYNTSTKEMPHSLRPFSNGQNWCWPIRIKEVHPAEAKGWFLADASDFKRFPFSNFTYCLTLFPKFFSSFPHGTCSLSVSRLYLALDGIYHPFWAAFPNNSTLWEHTTKPQKKPISKTGFSPSMTLHSRRLIYGFQRG